MKSGCRMIRQVICRYVLVFCTLSFVVRCCRGLPNSLERKFSIFFDFFGKLDVSVLFVKVVVKSVNFVFEKNPGPTQYNTDHHELIIRPFMQNHSSTMQLTSPISSENLMQSRLDDLGLQSMTSIDVGVADDCFFRSVSHQLYGNSNHHMRIHTAGVQCMREKPREIY